MTDEKPTISKSLYLLSIAIYLTFIDLLRDIVAYFLNYTKHVIAEFVILILFCTIIFTGNSINALYSIDKSSDILYDSIVKASRINKIFRPTDTIKSIRSPGAPDWMKRESVRAILTTAKIAGLDIEDQTILLVTADIESGLNPLAKSDITTACGLFQFVKQTGKEFDVNQENCLDPWKNSRAAVYHYIRNYRKKIHSNNINTVPSELKILKMFELSYFYHHDGINAKEKSRTVEQVTAGSLDLLLTIYTILKEDKLHKVKHNTTFIKKCLQTIYNLPSNMINWYYDAPLYRYLLEVNKKINENKLV